MAPRTKFTAQDLLAAAAQLPAEERRAVAAALRPQDIADADDEAIAEVTMASALRMLDSSRDVLAQALASVERVNDELARGWF